jgi:hypothetical protein
MGFYGAHQKTPLFEFEFSPFPSISSNFETPHSSSILQFCVVVNPKQRNLAFVCARTTNEKNNRGGVKLK